MAYKKLKLSPYTFLVKLDGKGSVASNFASGEVAQLSELETRSLQNQDADCEDKFLESTFLVEDEEITRRRVIDRHRQACYSPAVFNLALLPTLSCNFSCSYCFEKGAPGKRMNEEIIERVIRLTQKRAPAHLRTELSWYGGEPLLEIDCISNAHPRIRETVLSCGSEFNSSITTNGYLLNKEASLLLKELKINFIHITIDGNKKVHDQSRVTKEGAHTFEQIMDNLLSYLDIYPDGTAMIRVNTTYNTASTILDVLQNIPLHYRKRLSLYLSRIISDQCNEGLSNQLSTLFMEIYKESRKLGFKVSVDDLINPGPAVYCYAERVTSAVVDPEGFIFRCAYSDFSEEERVGILNEDGDIQETGKFGSYWNSLVSTEPDECLDCIYLPLCGFGCPRKRVVKPMDSQCKNQFYFMPDTLTALAAESQK